MKGANRYRRSKQLSREEWDAVYRSKEMLPIRTGAEWADCPNCIAGITTANLGMVMLSGRCVLCCGTGRVLLAEKEHETAWAKEHPND